jgi:uncharacterized membrane protein
MTPAAKRLAILLAVSIGLNLLLAGLWIGRGMHRPLHGRGGHAATAHEPGHRKPPALRAFMENAPQLARHRQSTQQARAAVATALEAEPFDRAALDAAFDALRSETLKGQQALHQRLAEVAQQGSAQSRRELSQAFRRARRDN